MFFPATNDDKHFVIGVVPFVVYLFSILNIKGEIILKKFSILFTSIFIFSCIVSLDLLNDNFILERDINYFENYRYLLDKYEYDKLFIFSNFAYRFKLDNNIRIDKFDLINNGNMGYNGNNKYISEINKYCKNNKCLFLIGISELDRINPNQINLEILDFVYDNYDCIDKKGLFYFCIN